MIYTIGVEEKYEGMERRNVNECLKYFKDKPSLQLDTEGTGGDPHSSSILSLQLGDAVNQWFIDCRTVDILEFKELIEEKLCVAQNAKYDYKMLKAKGIMMENIFDTMLAECILYAGYDKWGYGLANIIKRYLGIEMNKEERAGFIKMKDEPFSESQIRYGCLDVTYLDAVRELQSQKLEELDLVRCHQLENEVVKAFADIEYNGMFLNSEAWLKIAHQTYLEAQNLVEKLDGVILADDILKPLYKPEYVQKGLFDEPERELSINYASPAQISKVCTHLGFPTESTDEKHLTRLKGKHEFFSNLIELRKKNKILSTYGKSFLKAVNPVTGRVHTSYWQIVSTGRSSSGNKKENAPNLQNIPRKGGFKSCFTSRPGYSWVSSDYSGQEARLMASATQDKALISIFNSGEDIHCSVGSMMFKKTITKADEEERYLAKTVAFMIPYGAESQKLADEMDIPVEEAEKLLKLHAEAFPELHKWLKVKGIQAKRNEYSITIGPIGRKRFYPDMIIAKSLRKQAKTGEKGLWRQIFIIEGQTERNGGNSPVQGAAGDMTKEAMIGVRNLVKEYNTLYDEEVAYIIGMVHDSIECEVKTILSKQFGEEMNQIMVDVANKYLDGVVMKVDTTISSKWGKD